MSIQDRDYMSHALRLARQGRYTTHPNPSVGCVIVRGGQVVGEGWHRQAGEPHAEIHALRQAQEAAQGAAVYVTLEPCSHTGRTGPCCQALIQAGVARVVIAMRDPNPQVAGRGSAALQRAGIQVECGLMAAEAAALNPGFISRMTLGRPYIRVKQAMSLDGRIALANGESQWITGEAARREVQDLRARSAAIMTGSGTVVQDNPALTVRPSQWQPESPYPLAQIRQPLRVVVDSQLQTPDSAQVVSDGGDTLLVTTQQTSKSWPEAVQVQRLPESQGKVDLAALMTHLAKLEVNDVLVEAGPGLVGALCQAQLLDEWLIYMAPTLLGDEGRGLAHLPQITQMSARLALQIVDIRAVGSDWRIRARPQWAR